jgi:MarR family transcriptional regulator, 2-MHQ and catechol-resistance regulon repressor
MPDRVATVSAVPNQTASPATCTAGDDRIVLFGLLLETNARLQRQLGAALEEAIGLPLPFLEVLIRVDRSEDGYLSMSELATQTVYSSGGTTRLVDRIEAQGLVERKACPNDRRAVHVRLTKSGEVTLARGLEVHAEHVEQYVSSKLTDKERHGLEVALRKLNEGPPVCARSSATRTR